MLLVVSVTACRFFWLLEPTGSKLSVSGPLGSASSLSNLGCAGACTSSLGIRADPLSETSCVCGPDLAAPFSSSVAEPLKVSQLFASVGGRLGQDLCPNSISRWPYGLFAWYHVSCFGRLGRVKRQSAAVGLNNSSLRRLPLSPSPFEDCRVFRARPACERAALLSSPPSEPLIFSRSGSSTCPGPFGCPGWRDNPTDCNSLLASLCAASVWSPAAQLAYQPGWALSPSVFLGCVLTSVRGLGLQHLPRLAFRASFAPALLQVDFFTNSRLRGLASAMQVPGASASTVVASESWASLQSLLDADPDLKAFLSGPSFGAHCAEFPFSFARSCAELLPRAASIAAVESDACGLLSLVFEHLAAKPFRRVSRGPLASPFSARGMRAAQPALARGWARVLDAVQAWNSYGAVDAGSMGRAAGKFEKVEEQIAALELTALQHGETEAASQRAPSLALAKDVEVSRLSFPPAPAFDPSSLFDRELRRLYLHPEAFCLHPDEVPGDPPRVKVRTSDRRARLDLLAALDAQHMLAMFPGEAACDRRSAGMFCIPKSLDRDRLILDARPGNRCSPLDSRWLSTLGSHTVLLDLVLRPSELLLASGEDIRDYYYNFEISPSRARQYILIGDFKPEEVSHFSSFEPRFWASSRVVVGLKTLAMGDVNAVSFGQAAHVGLVLASGAAGIGNLLTYRGRPPRDRLSLGVVIDDLLVLERTLRNECVATRGSGSRAVIAKIQAAYAQAPLPRHEGKGFLCESEVEVWGAQLNGDAGWVRPNWNRLVPLVHITLAALRLPLMSVSLLEILSGCWVASLSFRRRLLCLLFEVYRAQRGREREDLFRPSVELRAELFCLACLAPLVRTDLRALPATTFVATDASDDLGAGVCCEISETLAGELLRHSLTKGLWNRLLRPSDALLHAKGFLAPDEALPDGDCYRTSALWTQVNRSLPFRVLGSFRRPSWEHINIKELESYLVVEEKLSVTSWERSRPLSCLDSQVCLGALLKGRSSSQSLNFRLQSAVPGLLLFGVQPYYAFVASEDNCADDPTRRVPLRGPKHVKPPWLVAAEAGRFELLDAFLAEQGLDPLKLQGLSELESSFALRAEPDPGWDRSVAEAWKRESCLASPGPRAKAEAGAEERGSADAGGFPSEQLASLPKVPEEHSVSQPTAAAQSSSAAGFKSSFLGAAEAGGFPSEQAASLPSEVLVSAQKPSSALVRLFELVSDSQIIWPDSRRHRAGERPGGPGYLCLYAGSRRVAKAVSQVLGVWAITFDWKHGPGQDLSSSDLQAVLLEVVSSGSLVGVGLAPQCPSLSAAVQPSLRSALYPEGKPGLPSNSQAKVLSGNAQGSFVARIVAAAVRFRVPFWVEGPAGSWLWRLPCFEQILSSSSVGFWEFDCCVFNLPWRKRTRVLTNTGLAGQSDLCRGGHEHLVLRGRSKQRGLSWTRLSEDFPKGACSLLASAIGLGVSRPDAAVSSVVRDEAARIGEAKNPGPAAKRKPRTGSLFDVELVEPSTAKLRLSVWEVFKGWLHEKLAASTVIKLFSCPPLLALVLRDYGEELYKTGFPLGYYRQLLAHSQRVYPLVKPHLGIAWEMVSRWEELQPVCHRTPMPEILLKGLLGLALQLGWFRWAAATAAIFYGIARPGEVLRALRKHLLTPEDCWIQPTVGSTSGYANQKAGEKLRRYNISSWARPQCFLFFSEFGAISARASDFTPGVLQFTDEDGTDC